LNTTYSKRICEWAVYDPYADMLLIYGIGLLPFESSHIVLSSCRRTSIMLPKNIGKHLHLLTRMTHSEL